MTVDLTPRHLGRHAARVSPPEAPRNVAETPQEVAVTSLAESGAAAGVAGGTP